MTVLAIGINLLETQRIVMIEFFQNKYCTMREIERELEKYSEDFVVGEESTWWVMGSSKTEPPRKTSRELKWGVASQRCCQDRQRDHQLHFPNEPAAPTTRLLCGGLSPWPGFCTARRALGSLTS